MTADRMIPRPKRTGRLPFLVACLVSVGVPTGFAQNGAARRIEAPATAAEAQATAYDVMAIKLNNSVSDSVNIHTKNGSFSANNVSLKQLLEGIYDMRQDLISGISGPVESARFDMEAKIIDPDLGALGKMTPKERWQLLLPLLTDRFQLKVHTESRILPIYELAVLPSGPKFKSSASQTDSGGGSTGINSNGNRVALTAHDLPMTSLAKSLAGQVHRTVFDKTGLSGNFDLKMQWSTDDNPESGGETLPSIFTALQEQLGLKLQPARGPVATLVVDHAAMPSEN